MKNIRWIIPEAKEPSSKVVREEWAVTAMASGKHLRVGLLDNTKDNANLLLRLLGQQVCRELDGELLSPRRKANPAVGAGPEILDALADEADCVLTAMAD